MFSFKYLFLLIVGVFGHARLTFPIPRIKNVDGGLNAPIYTCLGPSFKTSPTSMRCHDAPAGNIVSTYTSGSMVDLEWVMEAPHPGDCSIWLSYDTNVDSPVSWIKIKDIPGCLSINGVDLPNGLNRFSFKLPDFLPSCEHCVLRWEWYAVQQVSNVEFYVNCADIKIVSLNNCQRPTPVTQINGIEHLLYNLNDPTQKGCPFYNVYDINIRPPLETRSRGPKEWVPTCNDINNPTPTPVPTLQPPIVYPCANINCGAFGNCNNNVCICKNGYTGKNCEIQPVISCNTNCKIFNRNTCQINNICGDCLKGFIGDNNIANSLCKIKCDNSVCKNINRKTCIEGNVCGNCLNGFTEPKSLKKSESCIESKINSNGIKLSISSQWKTGFCGLWTTICPKNRIILFEVPNEIRDLRGWNMINMVKVDNVITGYCASWIQEGKQASGGFCASFSFGKIVTIGKNGYVISQQSNRFRMLEIIDESYNNVSITVNVDPNALDHEPVYNEIQKNLYGTQEIMLLGLENSELSIKIKCENRQDFDNALFLDMNSMNPQFNPEPIAEEYDYNTLNASIRLNVSFLSMVFLILLIILI